MHDSTAARNPLLNEEGYDARFCVRTPDERQKGGERGRNFYRRCIVSIKSISGRVGAVGGISLSSTGKLTRLRPASLELYKARSAATSNVSRDEAWAGKVATPNEAVT